MHILLIARHYPPEISGGARRPYLLTQALRSQGHKVTLVTPFNLDDPDHICVPNTAIQRGLQKGLQADLKQDAPNQDEEANTTRNQQPSPKDILRQWLFWPDPDIRWARDVVKKLEASDIKPDWLMTTSPPESSHIAGAALARSLNVPWLAELRDTWISMPHRVILERSKIRAFFERRIAKRTLSKATAITGVSETVLQEARLYCPPNTPELVLPHFSRPARDDSAASGHKTKPVIFDKTSLNIVHTGGFSFSDRRRELGPLLDVLAPVSKNRPELVLHIVGPLSKAEKSLLKTASVRTLHHGSVSLDTAHAMQRQADGLLLYTPKDSHALPGKYAEYALAGRPILYFGGGSWLSLVEDKATLRPLIFGLETLRKGEKTKPTNVLTHHTAAKILFDFLCSVDTCEQAHPSFDT
ncbi:MAG: glycosyltransferase [Robiginitomaculum sp.]|nr:glycosyltransferase [Robiginitomaculum sp.]